MNKIQIKVLNPDVIPESEKMMVFTARLTQRGHNIKNMDDLVNLYNLPYKPETAELMSNLPHPTIQKFGKINIAIVGASRRFLAQITRHQNEVKFMSASLQYSDYSGQADFCVPISVIRGGQAAIDRYIKSCSRAMEDYQSFIQDGLDNDAAGYMVPSGLRNILIISATPYQFKHMISQRICRRNTLETRFISLLIWKELSKYSNMFDNAGAFCMRGPCLEGKMSCKNPLNKNMTAEDILKEDFGDII